MANEEHSPSKPIFRIPSASEVQERQRDLRNKASIPTFKPTGLKNSESSTSTGSPSNIVSGSRNTSQTIRSTEKTVAALPHAARPTVQDSRAPVERTLKQPAVPQYRPPPARAGTSNLLHNREQSRHNTGQSSGPQRQKSTHSIVVNSCQVLSALPSPKWSAWLTLFHDKRGNGILNFIKNVPWEYGEIIPDYQVGQTSCALFLSLKYHRLHPEYVYTRIKQLGHHYLLRILLCLVDIEDHQSSIRDLTRICVYNNITLILAWSQEEAGRYLETFKAYEHKPPDIIKERVDPDYLSKLTDALTQVKTVNKTDVLTLASAFGSLKDIIAASPDELAQCPGFGEQKVRRLQEAFNQPFVLNKKTGGANR